MTQTTRNDEMSWHSTPVPAARAIENFSAAEVGADEYVFLDNERLEYHTLNASAFAVWKLCDGVRTSTDISGALAQSATRLPVEAVDLAVVELGEAGLLKISDSWTGRLDRRRVVKMAAASVLGAAVLPAVSSITAPVGANLTTCTPGANIIAGQACNCSSECVSPLCCCSGTSTCGARAGASGNCSAAGAGSCLAD